MFGVKNKMNPFHYTYSLYQYIFKMFKFFFPKVKYKFEINKIIIKGDEVKIDMDVSIEKEIEYIIVHNKLDI